MRMLFVLSGALLIACSSPSAPSDPCVAAATGVLIEPDGRQLPDWANPTCMRASESKAFGYPTDPTIPCTCS